MPINPLISMQGQPVDFGGAVAQGLNAYQGAQRNALIQDQAALQKPMIEAQTQQAQQQLTREQALYQLGDAATDAVAIKPVMQADPQRAIQMIDSRVAKIQARGGDPTDTLAVKQLIANGQYDQASKELDSVIQAAAQHGAIKLPTMQQQGFGTSPTYFKDPSTGKIIAAQGSEAGGFYANGKPIPSSYEPIANPNTMFSELNQNQRFFMQPEMARRTEEAKAGVELATKPQIEAATTTAKGSAQAKIDQAALAKANNTAMNVYEAGVNNLLKALGDTTTGPVSGRIPAVTANQQIAEGAQAAMAPVLKQMFRQAGEGTFTDRDQAMLIDMLPTRKDHPEAAKAKMQGIDAIVRAKLGQAQQSGPSLDDLVNKYAD